MSIATAVAAWLHMMSLLLLSPSDITYTTYLLLYFVPAPSITAAARLLNRVQHDASSAS